MKWVTLRKRVWRSSLVVLVILIFLSGVGFAYQSSASAKDREAYAPMGRLIQVNGHEMHLHCMGEGSPTVILESGVGGNTLLWSYIQPVIAEKTSVCAYDRAGYGWSEENSTRRTIPQITDELYTLLTQANIEPPYILTGHSFGGLVIRNFASRYPDDVVGLVLIDATHPNQFSSENCSPACFPSSIVTVVDALYEVLSVVARVGVVRLLVPTGMLPLPFFSIPADFPNRDALIALFSTNAHSDTVLAEWDAFAESARLLGEETEVIDLPVRIVTGHNTYYEQPLPGEDPEKTTQTWDALQSDLLGISINSEQTIIEEATHFSLLVNPNHADQVSEIIIQLVEETQ